MKNVVFCVNNNVIIDLVVCLESLFTNTPGPFTVFILHHNLLDCETIKRVCVKYKARVIFLQVDEIQFLDFPTFQGNYITYYRFWIPNVLPKSVKRVLYLDADIVVNKDISYLWTMDLQEGLAAIPDVAPSLEHTKMLGIPNRSYFNAGVLVMNLTYMRKHHIMQDILRYLKKNADKVRYHDQDALNVIFARRYKQLPRCYNHGSFFTLTQKNLPLNEIFIVHYYGTIKPKYLSSAHPFRRLWRMYALKSPLRYKPPITVKECIYWFLVRINVVVSYCGLLWLKQRLLAPSLQGNR